MLDGFRLLEENGFCVLARSEYAEALVAPLTQLSGCTPMSVAGRGTVYSFSLGGLDCEGVLRPYQHGGVVGNIMGNKYLSNRALNELRVMEYLRVKGFPVPEPLGIAWKRSGFVLECSIATRRIESMHLQDYLNQAEPDDQTLVETGRLIRGMHDLGVIHADLQLRNILVSREGVYFIDFDKAKRYGTTGSISRKWNLLRLRRSFEKNCVEPHWYTVILDGYGEDSAVAWLEALYSVKSLFSDIFRKREDGAPKR